MPTVASSPSPLTHSWVLVYSSSLGTLMDLLLRLSILALVERQRHGASQDETVPDYHLELVFDVGLDEREPYGLVQGWREGPASDVPDQLSVHRDRVAVARDPSPLDLEAGEPLSQALLALPTQ